MLDLLLSKSNPTHSPSSPSHKLQMTPISFSQLRMLNAQQPKKHDSSCREHPDTAAEIFCVTDGMAVCHECVEYHHEHVMKSLKAAAEGLVEKAAGIQPKLVTTIKSYEEEVKKVWPCLMWKLMHVLEGKIDEFVIICMFYVLEC